MIQGGLTMSKKAAVKLLVALGPVAIRRALKVLLRLNVVKHVGGKLILTQGGRYVAKTLGAKASLAQASGPLSIVLTAVMLGIDIYLFMRSNGSEASAAPFSTAGFDPMSWMPGRA
jgi:hypothetical protein